MLTNDETEWVRKMAEMEDEFGDFPSIGRSPKLKFVKVDPKEQIPFWNRNVPEVLDTVQKGVEPIYSERYYRRCISDQECLIEKFFKDQEKFPLHMRSSSCLISCTCSKCRTWCL